MPVFNTAKYLPDAISSITDQTLQDFEFIIIDDGSQDQSLEILRSVEKSEKRMRVITRPNRGLISTRNELLGEASAELVAWMDSDDVSLRNRLAMQVRIFQDSPETVCVGTAAQCVDPNGKHLNLELYPTEHENILAEQQRGGAMRFPTTMMRRETALAVGGFREPFRIGEDFDLLLRLSEIGEMRNLAEPLYLYRQHVASVCAQLGPSWSAYRDEILELARERRTLGADRLQRGIPVTIQPTALSDVRQLESAIFRQWSVAAMANRDYKLSMKYVVAAILKKPRSIAPWKNAIRMMLAVITAVKCRARES